MTYSTKKSWMLVVAFLLCGGIFAFFYFQSYNRVENVPREETPLDKWTLENSVLNGVELVENKNIYKNDNPVSLDTVYITVFPTKTEEGIIDFSAFDLHQSHIKTYNPQLDINLTFGDEKGGLPMLASTNNVNGIMRVRGNSARGERFKSYNIKLTDKESNGLNGMKSLNINKHVGDKSKITNKLALDLFKRMDNITSFRTIFLRVYIKDASLPLENQEFKYYGLHTHVEQPNKAYLRSHGLDENGTLYKANMFEFRKNEKLRNIDDPLYDEVEFESVLAIREGTDHSKLLGMLEDVNDMNENFDKIFNKYFNEENYLTWMAANILLGSEDIVSHNYLLYSPNNSLTWYFLPWDYDKIFNINLGRSLRETQSIKMGAQKLTGVQLHGRYLRQPGNIDKLTAKIKELKETIFVEKDMKDLIDSYRPILEEMMSIEPDVGMLSFPPSQLNEYLDEFPAYIQAKYDDYMASLEYPIPFFTAAPEKLPDGRTKFAWDSSFDFNGDLLKYSIRLTTDIQSQNVVFEVKDLINTEYIYEGDLSGMYYMDIKVYDSDGNTQFSHDTYVNLVMPYFSFGRREVIIE